MTDPALNGHADQQAAHTAPEIERQVIGACLLDDAACATAVGLLADVPAAFADRTHGHQAIFETIVRLFAAGEPTDLVTVSQEIPDARKHLSLCTSEVGTTTSVERQCRILQEMWMTRRTLRLIDRARGFIADPDSDIFEGVETLQHRLFEVQAPGQSQAHVKHAAAAAVETAARWEKGERTDTVPSGLVSLDDAVGGLFRRELTTLAAQTGAGKTSLLIQMAVSQAKRLAGQEGGCALVFSCEMSAEQLTHRAAAALAEVDLRMLRGGEADAADYKAFRAALADLSDLPLYIDDDPAPSFAHITARCQRLKARHGALDFVGVDYLEKVRHDAPSEELRVSGIAKFLKETAKRVDAAVVALCQYSRKASGNTGAPSDAWLRYSGKIEHESAMILHWWWPGWFIEKGYDMADVEHYTATPDGDDPAHFWGYLSMTKNRFGPTPPPRGLPLFFDPTHTRFLDPKDPEVQRAGVLPATPGGSEAPF